MIEITVAQDGTADFNSIQEAIDQILSLRAGSSESCTIFIKSGIYQEKNSSEPAGCPVDRRERRRHDHYIWRLCS